MGGWCQAYFGDNFDEDSVRNHFTLIYELMDETMDYGYPQVGETEQARRRVGKRAGLLGWSVHVLVVGVVRCLWVWVPDWPSVLSCPGLWWCCVELLHRGATAVHQPGHGAVGGAAGAHRAHLADHGTDRLEEGRHPTPEERGG